MGPRTPKPHGWIVRLGAEVIVQFRYPEPGYKTSFLPAANERMLAAACIAMLGKGPGYEWPAQSKSSAEYVAKELGGKVERAIAPTPMPPADTKQDSAPSAPTVPPCDLAGQTRLWPKAH